MFQRVRQIPITCVFLIGVIASEELIPAQELSSFSPRTKPLNVKTLRLVPVAQLASRSALTSRSQLTSDESDSCSSRTNFFTNEIQELRMRAQAAARLPSNTPDGLSVSTVDPANSVAAFPPLHIRHGFTLRGYEDRWDSNGVGFVRAFLPGQPAPLPGAVLPASARRQVSRAGLENNPMRAITGDGSAWSYLCASILAREFEEFGARWHGQRWATHTLLTRNPWDELPEDTNRSVGAFRTSRDEWQWDQDIPTDWRPKVQIGKEMIEVIFYTYSPLGQERVYRHKDTYQRGDYCAKSERAAIARGPQWMVF